MIIRETRRVSLAFAFRPDNFSTGRPAWPDDESLRVSSGDGLIRALPKDDGYFIFAGTRPDTIHVTSGMYEGFPFALNDCPVNILRVFLIPRNPAGRCVSLRLESSQCAHIGFYGEKTGYTLLPETTAGSSKITLNKDDFAEITGLFHALVHSGETERPVFVSDNLGYGRYRLLEPFPENYPIRGTRLLPLLRIVGNGGKMRIPVPNGSLGAYLLRGGVLQKISLEEWGE